LIQEKALVEDEYKYKNLFDSDTIHIMQEKIRSRCILDSTIADLQFEKMVNEIIVRFMMKWK